MEPVDRCSSFAEIVSRMQTIGSEIGKPDEETGEIESWNKNHIQVEFGGNNKLPNLILYQCFDHCNIKTAL